MIPRIVIEGIYFAKPPKRDALGAARKRRVAYREEFTLSEPGLWYAGDRNAVGYILHNNLLNERLAKKDSEFRAVHTHHAIVIEGEV